VSSRKDKWRERVRALSVKTQILVRAKGNPAVKETGQKLSRKPWPYSGHRIKRWKEKNGVGVFTLIPPDMAQALKREVKRHGKPQWKLLRACIDYGFHVAMRRGF